jgi:SAM-dependent methyltransferase
VGVDFAARAIAKARRACARCELHVADVTRLGFLDGPFDLALDIGCLHTLAAPARRRYAAGLSRLVRPAGTYLLYAFAPGGPAVGVSRADVAATFADAFELVSVEEGRGRPSAWYTLVRR